MIDRKQKNFSVCLLCNSPETNGANDYWIKRPIGRLSEERALVNCALGKQSANYCFTQYDRLTISSALQAYCPIGVEADHLTKVAPR